MKLASLALPRAAHSCRTFPCFLWAPACPSFCPDQHKPAQTWIKAQHFYWMDHQVQPNLSQLLCVAAKARTEAQAVRAALVRWLSTRPQRLWCVTVTPPFFCLVGCFFSVLVCSFMLGALSEGGMSQSLAAPACSLFLQLQPSRRTKLSSSKHCPRIRSEWFFS